MRFTNISYLATLSPQKRQQRNELKACYTIGGFILCTIGLLAYTGLRDNSIWKWSNNNNLESSNYITFSSSLSTLGRARLLETTEECLEEHPEFCALDQELGACFTVNLLDGACCISHPGETILSNLTGFEELDDFQKGETICMSRANEVCAKADMCVAELIPGKSSGAECFAGFETQRGSAIAIYLIILLYLFIALAIVCDDYFAYSLDRIASMYGVAPDVKGATFAAAGSSAPELFVSLADNVFSNPPQSVGIGAVLGSAIFNILCIIGFSSIIAQRFDGLAVAWRPFLRDSIFYLLAVICLIGVVLEGEVTDNKVFWWEGLIFVLLYILYIVVMFNNQKLFLMIDGWFAKKGQDGSREIVPLGEQNEFEIQRATSYQSFMDVKHRRGSRTNLGGGHIESPDQEELYSKGISPDYFENLKWPRYVPEDLDFDDEDPTFWTTCCGGGWGLWLRRAYFILVFPINLLYRFTIPDSRFDIFKEDVQTELGFDRSKRIKAYYAEFVVSIVYLAILSQGLVFTASKIGCLAGISPSVMGLTFLAVGTSLPDCMTGMHLAANQEGDAAVADALGSNIFDILLCLGLPWFLASLFYDHAELNLGDVWLVISFLFLVFFLLVIGLWRTGFMLNAKLGYGLVSVYVIYIVFEFVLGGNS